MLRVNATSRVLGLHLAVWFWTKDKAHMPVFGVKDLEGTGTVEKVEANYSTLGPEEWLQSYSMRQEAFSRKYVKDTDRLFMSDVIDAYEWYVGVLKAHDAVGKLGLTFQDLVIPEDKWDWYRSGTWSCSEEQQTCINLACEMATADGARYMLSKLLRAFSISRSCGFNPNYWMGNVPLSEGLPGKLEEAPEEEKEKPVTCCFTVSAEVAEWLKEKKNMSRFIAGLIREEMESL